MIPFDRPPRTSYRHSIVTMALYGVVSEINGDSSRKLQIFPTHLYFAPPPLLEGFPLELGIGAGGQKLELWSYRVEKDDIFNRVDTIHQRDRRADRPQTHGDSKDRAYA